MKALNLEEEIMHLDIPESKKIEIKKSKKLSDNLNMIFKLTDNRSKIVYILSTLIDIKKNNITEDNLKEVVKLIEEGVIGNEKILKFALEEVKNKNSLSGFDTSYDGIEDFIKKSTLGRKELLKEISKHKKFRFAPGNEVIKLMDKLCINKDTKVSKCKDEYGTGEISFMHKPGENPQLNDKIMEEHLKRTGGKVVTRFPPEPNGFLHIGHAKALNLDFGYAEKYGGITYLRYDDTNPKNEKEIYYKKVLEDVEWLGFKPYKITAASDYFQKLIDFGIELIKKGKAFVCHQTPEEMKDSRKNLTPSPWRERSIAVNLELFNEMIEGKWKEGEISLRLKMDYKSKNPLLHDLVAFRVIDHPHCRTGNKFKIYPAYDFTHCISDSLEDITHSFCSREFYQRKETYYWVVDNLEIYRPVQWEFSRLNISNTILSKRKLTRLIDNSVVDGWDDPRLPTIQGLRRRGYTPESINRFAKEVGITYNETIVDIKILESFLREDLFKKSKRIMAVRNPYKLVVENFNGPFTVDFNDKNSNNENNILKVSNTIFIDSSDILDTTDPDYHRLTPTQPVGLYKLFTVRVKKMYADYATVEIVDEKPKKYIQWVSDGIPVELRMYKNLFKSSNPEEVDMMTDINPDSLKIIEGLADRRIEKCQIEDKYQFQRIGYFCIDKDTDKENGKIVANLTIELKGSNV
ncbi:Glutaminyl-tRNA synthetase [Spraguea lophii 42_110]|uniref:glutamine--tRNA ligase n=1 Tax=Spraguea lophii (strain 42_110) TaxID=1358809 RepID=S7XT44_SPRLO|nr:Glutaminyl-tRNA synthetase [Spraguea lophii 42_110]